MRYPSLKESLYIHRWPFLVAILLFALGVYTGYAIGLFSPAGSETAGLESVMKELERLAKFIKLYTIQGALFVALKNTLTAVLAFFLGIIFAIPTALILLLNGFIVGFAASKFPADIFLMGVLPHGIFEMPAFLLASSAGLRLGAAFVKKISASLKHEPYSLMQVMAEGLPLLFLSIALLFIAAFIEVFITPSLVPLNQTSPLS